MKTPCSSWRNHAKCSNSVDVVVIFPLYIGENMRQIELDCCVECYKEYWKDIKDMKVYMDATAVKANNYIPYE